MTIEISNMEKYIGVEVDDQLRFSSHIDTITKKANSKAGWLRRSFRFMTPILFRPLYIAIVRSQLEYAAPVWSPYRQHDIDKLESVQVRATKMLPGFKTKTYEERLIALNLPTLRYRRLRGDMIMVYKILSGKHTRSRSYRKKRQEFNGASPTQMQNRYSKVLFLLSCGVSLEYSA